MYDSETGRWFVIDPLAEKYYPISPFAYVGNNPIRRVDVDGRDWWDKVVGSAIGVATNVIPLSTQAREWYTPNDAEDYNSILQTVDEAAEKVGVAMAVMGATGVGAGLGMMGAGATVTALSGGTLAVAGAPVALIGAQAALSGVVSGFAGTVVAANSLDNQQKGYNYGEKSSEKTKQYKRISNQQMDKLKKNGFEPHDNKPKQGNKGGKIDYYKDKDGNIYYRTDKGSHYESTGYNIDEFDI